MKLHKKNYIKNPKNFHLKIWFCYLPHTQPTPQPPTALPKNFAMRVQVMQLHNIANDFINQHQVRLDMTITKANKITRQWVVFVSFGHWFGIQQAIRHFRPFLTNQRQTMLSQITLKRLRHIEFAFSHEPSPLSLD